MTTSIQNDDQRQVRDGRGRRWRWIGRGALALSMLMVVLLTGVTWVGFPDFVTKRLLALASTGGWYVDARRLTLDVRGGIVGHELKVYRKGVAGPPSFEAKVVRIRFSLLESSKGGRSRIRELSARDGVVRAFGPLSGDGKGVGSGWGAEAGAAAKTGVAAAPGTVDVWVRLDNVRVLGVPLRHAQGRYRGSGQGMGLSDLNLVLGDELHSGGLQGEVNRDADGRIHGSVVSRMDPHWIQPLFAAVGLDASVVVDRFSFHSELPTIEATFDIPAGGRATLKAAGRFQASEFAYQGAGVGFANIKWTYELSTDGHRLVLNPMVLVVRGKSVTGWVGIDFGGQWVDGEVVSMIDVPTLARLVGLPQKDIPKGWTFGDAARLYAKGRYSYGHPAVSAFELAAEGQDWQIGRFHLDELSLKWQQRGVTNELTDVRGRVAGGSVTGWALFVPEGGTSTTYRYTLRGEVLHAELARLMPMISRDAVRPLDGKVFGSLELTGTGASDLAGRGTLNITGGRIFTLPLFGGLTEQLTSRFAGVDMLLLQREVRATYAIGEGRIQTKDLRIDGDLFSVEAEGACGLDGQLGFTVKVRPVTERKVVGTAMRWLTLPLSKLLEFRLEGTIKEPRWKSSALSWTLMRDDNGKKGGKP